MSGLPPPNVLSYEGQVAVPSINRTFPPNSGNYQFNVPTIWMDTQGKVAYILVAKPMNVADWIAFAGGPPTVDKFEVDTFTSPGTNPVLPTALGVVTVTGGQIAAGTTANVIQTDSLAANTYTIEIQRSQAVASSTIGDNGVSHFSSADFNVDANGFVTLSGSGSSAIQKFTVDTFTSPGTNPVLPDGTGNVTITGGQIAAGTTANVIQTDSLAANSYTIEVQRSQAVASSTIGDNGVSHYNSADFTVDGNGFVSLATVIAPFSTKNQVFINSGTYTPTPGMVYCQIEVLAGGGGGGGAVNTTGGGENSFGAGGGGGEYARGIFSAAAVGASVAVTIGAGGASNVGTTGGTGGASQIGLLISCVGGTGGASLQYAGGPQQIAGGLGGTGGSGGDFRTAGQNGEEGNANLYGGAGANSQYGSGGNSSVNYVNSGIPVGGQQGMGYGSGGGGGANSNNLTAVGGGLGTSGIIIIQEYIT